MNLSSFIQNILNWIFPPSESASHIESLTTESFYKQALPPKEQCNEYTTSLFSYKSPLVQQAVWELKYRGNSHIAKTLGNLLFIAIFEKLADDLLFSNTTSALLIPLPLSRERYKERGWNQSAMLCRAIITHDSQNILSYSDKILIKIRHTSPQTKLSRKERQENLKSCFQVKNPAHIYRRDIILIDDVTTTGSTIEEARNLLLKEGARSVIAFTVAH